MFSLKGNSRSNSNSSDKQLKKLRRQDLLELLVEQLSENERLQGELAVAQSSVSSLSDQVERLKDKLDDKDVLINRLIARLDEKDTVLAELFKGVKDIAEWEGDISRESLLQLEEIAAEYYLRQFARDVADEDETEADE